MAHQIPDAALSALHYGPRTPGVSTPEERRREKQSPRPALFLLVTASCLLSYVALETLLTTAIQ